MEFIETSILASKFKNSLTMNLIENCKNSRFIDLMLGL